MAKELDQKRSRILLYISGAVVLALICVLIALPYAIEYVLEKKLVALGAETAVIDDVDLNPFTGTLVVKGLTITAEGAERLTLDTFSVDAHIRPLFSRRVHLKDISVEGLKMEVTQKEGRLFIGGLRPVGLKDSEKKSTSKWGIGLEDFSMRGSSVAYITAGLRTNIDIYDLSAKGLESWSPEKHSSVAFRGAINGAELSINADSTPFSDSPSVKGDVNLSDFSISPFNTLVGEGVQKLHGALDIDTVFELKSEPAGGLMLYNTGTVAVRKAGLNVKGLSVGNEELIWEGVAGLSFRREGGAGLLKSLKGKAVLSGFTLEGSEKGMVFIGFETLSATDIDTAGTASIMAGGVTIGDFYAGRTRAGQDRIASENTFLEASAVRANGISVKNLESVAVGDVEFKDLSLLLHRRQDGSFLFIKGMAGGGEGQKKSNSDASRTTYRIGRVTITGESVVMLRDENVKPEYSADLHIESLTFEGIDSEEPRKKSALEFDGRLNKYTDIKTTGLIEAFGERLTFDLKGEINDLDLPPLSGYALRNLGYNITSGHLDAEYGVAVKGGKLDGKTDVLFTGVEVDPIESSRIEHLTKELTMPLDVALSLLRDKKGRIKLTIPVTGDITSPEFRIASVINRAIGGAMKKSAIAYLKYTFQPYGTFITIAKIAGEIAFRIRLDPVTFESGGEELDETALAYLGKVAELMKDRPKVEIRVCGFATSSEAGIVFGGPTDTKAEDLTEAGREKLKNLARRRAEVVKEELVINLSVEPGRLFICLPEVDSAEEARPRVELLI